MARQDSLSAPSAIAAWLVHIFTASGVVFALLAMLAIEQQRWTLALLWLAVSGAIDGVDGSLARWARVEERLPRIDGNALDLVVDYLTYVFVPALFIWRAGLVPADLAPWLTGAILLSSLYVFARTDMKTDDGYFRGFPALWSVVAFYLFVLQPGAVTGAIVVAVLVGLTFAPIHFVHPFRVRDYGAWLPGIAIAWALATCALLLPDWGPGARSALSATSILGAAALVTLGLRRTLRGR